MLVDLLQSCRFIQISAMKSPKIIDRDYGKNKFWVNL